MASTALVLLALVAMAAMSEADQRPWFCRNYACPPFTAQDMGVYDIRHYPVTKWAATSVTSVNPDPSVLQRRDMFRKLLRYIRGANVNSERLDMTLPVLNKVENRTTDFQFTMMFYLTNPLPPAPTETGVTIVTRPEQDVFVRLFPGWMTVSYDTFREELKIMKSALDTTTSTTNTTNSTPYVPNVYYRPGYNSANNVFGRKQYEVWLDKRQ